MATNRYALLDRISRPHGCGCHGEDDDAELAQLEYDRAEWHARRKRAKEKRLKKAAEEAPDEVRMVAEAPADTSEAAPPPRKPARRRALSAPKKRVGVPPGGPGAPDLAPGGASGPAEPAGLPEAHGLHLNDWTLEASSQKSTDYLQDPEDDDR